MDSTLESASETSSTITEQFPSVHRLAFHGSGRELFDIFIINLLKTIATLGIYSFWAKTETRKYLWGHSEFAGDRFGYHGMGKELMIGWIKAAGLFGALFALQWAVSIADYPLAKILSAGVFYIGLAVLVPLVQIGSMRYRLSRTSWRGIRFTFRGQYRPFLWLSLRGFLLIALTLGIYYPYYHCNVRRFMTEHSYFGTAPFRFNGKGDDVIKIYGSVVVIAFLSIFLIVMAALALGGIIFLLLLPAFAALRLWLSTERQKYYWTQTGFDACVFKSTMTTDAMTGIYAGNLFYLVITLGMALPWTKVRIMKYTLEHLYLQGVLNLEGITQQAMTAQAAGDELASLLDVDGIFG